jgi:hypothetical protein
MHNGPRSNWKYPIPTKAQAKAAGISMDDMIKTHNAALSYSARSDTAASYPAIAKIVKKRGVVTPGKFKGNGGRSR